MAGTSPAMGSVSFSVITGPQRPASVGSGRRCETRWSMMNCGVRGTSSWITGSRPRHGSRSARRARRPG